jgi:hypothetical protein
MAAKAAEGGNIDEQTDSEEERPVRKSKSKKG